MLPVYLMAIAAPWTIVFGVLYFREANSTHKKEKERQCESTQT